MRRRGVSIRDIETRLGIARSTLSYWFRNVILAPHYQKRLEQRRKNALLFARTKASLWHREQKQLRIKEALRQATEFLNSLDWYDHRLTELALALLYMGEGFKKGTGAGTGMGNSDPVILRFFLSTLEQLYGLRRGTFRYELHLRADQEPKKLVRFWAKQLRVAEGRFRSPVVDRRTVGRPTYPGYFGVCSIQCGNIAIQRKLVYIANLFCQRVSSGA